MVGFRGRRIGSVERQETATGTSHVIEFNQTTAWISYIHSTQSSNASFRIALFGRFCLSGMPSVRGAGYSNAGTQ